MDWNEDGLKDLIVGEYNGKIRYYRNTGEIGNPILTFDSYLQCSGLDIDCGDYSAPYSQDWNEDGMKDLLVGDSDGMVYLFINVGTNAAPVFDTQSNVMLGAGGVLDYGSRSGPVIVDFDNDGLKDLVSGDINGKVYWCKNTGTNANPYLTVPEELMLGASPIMTQSTSRIDVVDWNQDGEFDLLVGNYDSRVQLYLRTDVTPPQSAMTLVRTSGVMVPTSGGTVSYTITVDNGTAVTTDFDVWTVATLPSGTMTEPIIFRQGMTLEPGGHIGRSIDQNIPGSAPNGIYYYYGYIGDYEGLQIYSTGNFYFYKFDFDGVSGGEIINDWNTSGWGEDPQAILKSAPSVFELLPAYPNPFNPETSLAYNLPEDGFISLAIYDIEGREVVDLDEGFRLAGHYEVVFNAADLSSGVYFAQLISGNSIATQKLMLIK